MELLFISIGVFILAMVDLLIFLGLWTYSDAKARTDQPAVWTLIVLLVPNLLGFIIYLLAGRAKGVKGPGKFKKPLIVSAVMFTAACGLLIGSFVYTVVLDKDFSPGFSRASFGKVENFWNRQWSVSFRSSTEELSQTITVTEEDLNIFRITGNCESGKLYLTALQNDVVKTWDISDNFDEKPDMSLFSAGKIKLLILNDGASRAKITINWRDGEQ